MLDHHQFGSRDLSAESFGCDSSHGTRARFCGVERSRSERTDGPQSGARRQTRQPLRHYARRAWHRMGGSMPRSVANPRRLDHCHSDGAKPSIHDANTPNGEKTTRPSAQNRSAARRNADTPAEPHPNRSARAGLNALSSAPQATRNGSVVNRSAAATAFVTAGPKPLIPFGRRDGCPCWRGAHRPSGRSSTRLPCWSDVRRRMEDPKAHGSRSGVGSRPTCRSW